MFTTLLVIATVVATALGAAAGYLATRPTVSRIRAELADVAWQLIRDPLTGLLNRTGLRTIHTAFASANQPQPIIVVLIDLDGFKDVNDTYSHDAGDDLLMEIADRLDQLAEAHHGTVARLSGDEFAVIAPLRHHNASRLADLITTRIPEPVEIPAEPNPVTITVTASLGVAIVTSTDPLEEVGLHHADIAMYHAKHQGGDRYVLHVPGMSMPNREHRRGPRLRELRRDYRGSAQ